MDEESAARGGEYRVCCTGDVVVGEEIRFQRTTFNGSFRRPKLAGYELITGTVMRDSYGEESQQHTFTLRLADGSELRIKGRNLYREGIYRKPWVDEPARLAAQQEKHARGGQARRRRVVRGQGKLD